MDVCIVGAAQGPAEGASGSGRESGRNDYRGHLSPHAEEKGLEGRIWVPELVLE